MQKQSQEPSNKIQNAIEVKNITVAFDDNTLIDQMSFEITQGDIAVIIGPNGSGKTTLLKAMAGLIEPRSGYIHIFGKHPHDVRREIGYVPQRFSFDRTFPITVKEFLKLSACPSEYAYIDELLGHVNMAAKKEARLSNLSGGELQRILIARALLRKPQILFLDEPASGIDIAGEQNFYELVKHIHIKHKVTIVIVSHELDIVFKFADQVLCINKKLVCYGAPKKVLTDEVFKELYGHDVGIYEHNR